MEERMKCHICGNENRHLIWTELGIGVVEEYYACDYCGYFMEMAYCPIHDGIQILSPKKWLRQAVLLWKNRKKLHGLKIGRSHF